VLQRGLPPRRGPLWPRAATYGTLCAAPRLRGTSRAGAWSSSSGHTPIVSVDILQQAGDAIRTRDIQLGKLDAAQRVEPAAQLLLVVVGPPLMATFSAMVRL
jgi:hypothetical protein